MKDALAITAIALGLSLSAAWAALLGYGAFGIITRLFF